MTWMRYEYGSWSAQSSQFGSGQIGRKGSVSSTGRRRMLSIRYIPSSPYWTRRYSRSSSMAASIASSAAKYSIRRAITAPDASTTLK
jgi:hypothetical protein